MLMIFFLKINLRCALTDEDFVKKVPAATRYLMMSKFIIIFFCRYGYYFFLRLSFNQEIIKVREWIPHIGPLTRVIHHNLFLDMVLSSSAKFTRAIFARCVFSRRKQRRRVMADRASSKRKFEVSNAPSNKRKKTSPNLCCSKERTCTLCDRNKIENLLLLDCTRSYAAIRCVLF